MKKIILSAAVLLLNTALFAQTKWTADKVHSTVKFSVSHLVISEVEGQFKNFEGTIASKSADFNNSAITFNIDVKSIDTENSDRDKHLLGPDFFDADKYPQMAFKSTSFKKLSGNKYLLTGNLTLHGVTKPVKFNVTYGGTAKDGYGNTKAGFKASTVINRFDYNLKWNALTEAGGATVGKDVTIELKLEFAQQKS
ncbi:YceI family protein [Arcticibacter tournemirensis]|uniref:Polyisoprenoid-binding protein n=1 Tax=Arcticibacter tournemirensis TaxID=699437 RepID=A0A4Q0MD22_9SPHI|nr:YceI family protein [Arcticibacter tournemirensis]RXF71277.1 polyisoprenoid-binding protein [Arcticibacter tournemirensis]